MEIRTRKRRWLAKILVVVMLVTCLPMAQRQEAEAADYQSNGCVRWVKDCARQKLGIQLPGTGYNAYGLAGASAYWKNLPANYTRGTEPAANALAVWEFSSNRTYKNYGHVAYVESVSGDTITLTEGGASIWICLSRTYGGTQGYNK